LKGHAGKIVWFLVDIPSIGFGTLKSRNNSLIYNSEKQRTLFVPDESNPAYQELSEFCLKSKIATDIFACTQTDIDLASLMPISAKLGGEIYYYPQFNSAEYAEKLHFDLFRNLTRYTVYDVSMKARCSVGLSINKYIGGFGEFIDEPVVLSMMDADKTIGFTIKQEIKLKVDTPAYLQFAILFTTPAGERKIRVFNYTLNVTDQISISLHCNY
jgi:protein transport protein SEC24